MGWLKAINALMTKPEGPEYETCSTCHGEGCRTCRGWGWDMRDDACLLPATGRECGDCSQRKWCKR